MAGSIGNSAIVVDQGTIRSDALNGELNARVNLADLAVELGLKADVLSSALPAPVRIGTCRADAVFRHRQPRCRRRYRRQRHSNSPPAR